MFSSQEKMQKCLCRTLQGVQKKIENSQSLEKKIVLIVQKDSRTFQSPKDHEIFHRQRRQVAEYQDIYELDLWEVC
jgi:hypothetical protein